MILLILIIKFNDNIKNNIKLLNDEDDKFFINNL